MLSNFERLNNFFLRKQDQPLLISLIEYYETMKKYSPYLNNENILPSILNSYKDNHEALIFNTGRYVRRGKKIDKIFIDIFKHENKHNI